MNLKKCTLVYIILIVSSCLCSAQVIKLPYIPLDTSYIKPFYKYLIVRTYESTKFASYKLIDRDYADRLAIKPNRHNNLGIGINYKFIGLNIGYGFPFLRKNAADYGKTKYLDLQSHLYLHRYLFDFYGQLYKGFYLPLSSPLTANPANQASIVRPDVETVDIGLIFQYNFNNKRFSYRAPFVQDEYQKKSAGSFLAGGGFYFGRLIGDSAFIPSNIKYPDFFNGSNFNQSNIVTLNADGGYAYTYVYKKHYFVTASVLLGAGINYSVLNNTLTKERNSGIDPEVNIDARFAAGYNSDKYFVIAYFIAYTSENVSPEKHCWEEINSGNLRIAIGKRFRLKRQITNKL